MRFEKIVIINDDEYTFTFNDDYIIYRKNGLLHRLDGPAVDGFLGYVEYYVEGKLHREDGPASTNANTNHAIRWGWKGYVTSNFDEWLLFSGIKDLSLITYIKLKYEI